MKTLLFVFLLPALVAVAPADAVSCIDVELGARPIPGDPNDYLEITWSVLNCGEAAARAYFTLTLQSGFDLLASVDFSANLSAGVPVSGKIRLPVPCCIPPGMYTLCVRGEIGAAVDKSCASIYVDEENNITAFSKILEPIAVESSTWGSIKSLYRY